MYPYDSSQGLTDTSTVIENSRRVVSLVTLTQYEDISRVVKPVTLYRFRYCNKTCGPTIVCIGLQYASLYLYNRKRPAPISLIVSQFLCTLVHDLTTLAFLFWTGPLTETPTWVSLCCPFVCLTLSLFVLHRVCFLFVNRMSSLFIFVFLF